MNNFINWIYDNNLFINYGIIYDTTDGCINQCRFSNAMWLLSVLVFTHKVIIDICINAPGHGRSKIYSINGSKKKNLKQKMCMIATEESNNESIVMNASSMIYDKNKTIKIKTFSGECFQDVFILNWSNWC